MPPAIPRKRRLRRKSEVCGAKTRKGTLCQMPAGHRTDHPGVGTCFYHGGRMKSHRVYGVKKQAIKFMGAPKDINPLDAIIWCIRITAGEVEWLSIKISEVDEDLWIEHTPLGKQMHVLQRTRADAQDRLVRYSSQAISLGLAERSIRLAEQFGATIARLLESVAGELNLNATQQKQWPQIVRKNLILLEASASPPEDLQLIEGNGNRRK